MSATRRPLAAALLALFAAAWTSCGQVDLSPRCRGDDDCPKNHLCNFLSATCYPAKTGAVLDLTSEVVGPFSCPYFDQTQTKLEQVGAPAAHGEFKGATYSFQIGCGVWPNKTDYELTLMASTLEPNLGAQLSVLIDGSQLKPGTLTAPAEAWGWLTTQKLGQPRLTRAMAWSGRMALTKVSTKAGEKVEGKLELKLVPVKNKPFGGLCQLRLKCDKTSCDGLGSLQAGSPDCKSGHYCFPFQDGTDRGVCMKRCTTDPECTSHDPKSRCHVTSSGVGVCLHICSSDSDCEAPVPCVPTMGCLG